MLPTEWVRFDEWYNFTTNPREDVHVLITGVKARRSWYEGAGHVDANYSDPLFLEHILGGIEWTAGVVSGGGDCVTFKEVGAVLTGLADGSQKYSKLSAQLAVYLADAENAANTGEHAEAVATLQKARGKAHGLQSDVLVSKLDDLITWQQGLLS